MNSDKIPLNIVLIKTATFGESYLPVGICCFCKHHFETFICYTKIELAKIFAMKKFELIFIYDFAGYFCD